MFLIEEDIFKLHKKIESGELVENNKEYHHEIAQALKDDYVLAFGCFATCSIEFYMWFTKDYLYEVTQIIKHHGQKELLIVLKEHLLEMVNGNPYDSRISSISSIYHFTYKSLL